jgi:hypothetical protein
MNYDREAAESIEGQYAEVAQRFDDLFLKTFAFGQRLTNDRAREFIHHGVARRLEMLKRSMEKIFQLFPVRRIKILKRQDRLDVEVNLHAFLINVYGILENLALALGYENDLISTKDKNKVRPRQANLFDLRFQNLLNPMFASYLRDQLTVWYVEYAKNYRDALAHRIPPYVPPSGLNKRQQARFADIEKELQSLTYASDLDRIMALRDEQKSIGTALAVYVHSFSEKARQVRLHPQVLTDFLTVEEVLKKAMDAFFLDDMRAASSNLKKQ